MRRLSFHIAVQHSASESDVSQDRQLLLVLVDELRAGHCGRPIHPRGDPAAAARVFVPNAGTKRSYSFKKGDSRILAEQTLEQQLRDSGYLHEG